MPYLYFQFADNRAIRKDDWKAVSARGGRWELFNIAEDRTELNDLATSQPDRLKELIDLWHEVAENVDEAPPNLRKRISETELQTFPKKWMTKRNAGP